VYASDKETTPNALIVFGSSSSSSSSSLTSSTSELVLKMGTMMPTSESRRSAPADAGNREFLELRNQCDDLGQTVTTHKVSYHCLK
jgi:hypothetical protein